MSWIMIDGWREDFNEGPYDYLAVRDGWEIYQFSSDGQYRVTGPSGDVNYFPSEKAAKNFAYANGCSRPKGD